MEMIWHWTQSDPELKYEGVIANYWTVEDWLYQEFCDELREEDKYNLYMGFTEVDRDSWFNWWLKKNDYLLGDIFWAIKEHNIL